MEDKTALVALCSLVLAIVVSLLMMPSFHMNPKKFAEDCRKINGVIIQNYCIKESVVLEVMR